MSLFESTEKVNYFNLVLIIGEETTYLSSDTPFQSNEDQEIQGEWFTSEFLNEIKCLGIPNHQLTLKVDVPIMLLRNIDQTNDLCNVTRLQVIELGKHVIFATFITWKNISDKIFIPRIDLVPSDLRLSFKFKRRQFLITMYFAMTINKSQYQSLSKVWLYLLLLVCTHGQLFCLLFLE